MTTRTVSTTELDPRDYECGSSETKSYRHDQIEGYDGGRLPIGPMVRFEVEEYDFDRLTHELMAIEQELECSSVEIFSRYINGQLSHDRDIQEWIDMVILYLGTPQVRQFSCP